MDIAAKPPMYSNARWFATSTLRPVPRIALVEVDRHRVVELPLADESGDVPHRGQDLVLNHANPLDHLPLDGRRGPFEEGQRPAEAVALAEDAREGALVAEEHGVANEVHLHGHGVLDLPGGFHPLVRLFQEPTVAGHAGDRLEADRPRGDEEQDDQQERPEKLRVDGRAEAGDAPHQESQRRSGQEQAWQRPAWTQGHLGGGNGGLGLVWAHAALSSAGGHATAFPRHCPRKSP
jgi:hypothetical protein